MAGVKTDLLIEVFHLNPEQLPNPCVCFHEEICQKCTMTSGQKRVYHSATGKDNVNCKENPTKIQGTPYDFYSYNLPFHHMRFNSCLLNWGGNGRPSRMKSHTKHQRNCFITEPSLKNQLAYSWLVVGFSVCVCVWNVFIKENIIKIELLIIYSLQVCCCANISSAYICFVQVEIVVVGQWGFLCTIICCNSDFTLAEVNHRISILS